MSTLVGQTVSHYTILSKLGEGGMGVVYKAEDTRLRRTVALKFLPPAFGEREKARLVREAQAVAQLDHPNICTVYEVEETGDSPFIAMAYVEGKTLKEKLETERLSLVEVYDYARQIGCGLQAAHRKKITHRDIKSSNIMVTPDGQVKIMDFGLAKLSGRTQLTREGSTAGTVTYMSPEQARGEEVDHRTDIWSFGVVVYELLTGRLPFQSDYEQAVVYSILNDNPPPLRDRNPDVSPELEAVVQRLLQKNKHDRYQSMDDVLLQLETFSGTVTRGHRLQRLFMGRRAVISAAALLALLIGATLLVFWFTVWSIHGIESIAVLPLENLSGDAEQEYLVEGLHDALITDLAKVGGFKRVIARPSVMRYRGKDTPVGEIARELNVDALVTGAVVRVGNTVRVTAQLINPLTESSLWAERYEREFRDVLSLQGEIVTAIASQLKLTLSPASAEALAKARPVNPETYEAYLRGMYWLQKDTEEAEKKGMEYLQEAVQKDPGDARAHAGLALGFMTIAHGAEPPPEIFSDARAAAERAMQLDSTLDMAYAARGLLRGYFEWEWEDAIAMLKRALELNPHEANVHYHLSWFYVLLGRWDEALAEHKRAQELDPLLPAYTAWLGVIYQSLGRYDEAIAECRKALEIDPNSPTAYQILGGIFAEQGKFEESIAAYEKAGAADSSWRYAICEGYAAAGRYDDIRKLLAELETLDPTPWRAFWRASIHTLLGNKEEAFRWLSYQPSHVWVPWVVASAPKLLRGDPRLDSLRNRFRLPPPTATRAERS